MKLKEKNTAYTPQISEIHSVAIYKLSQAVRRPMTKVLGSIIEYFLNGVDKDKVCKNGCMNSEGHPAVNECNNCCFVLSPPERPELSTRSFNLLFHLLRQETQHSNGVSNGICDMEDKLDKEVTGEVKVEDEVNELKMRIKSVSAFVNKKINKDFNSWGISFGAVGEILDEDVDQDDPRWIELLKKFDGRLKALVKESLPTPNK